VDLIVPVSCIVGDTDAEREADRSAMRASLSFYGSTPNYAFIWDEAGFEGTTARVRTHQKAGDIAAMMGEITDDHLAAFTTEATWDTLAQALVDKYAGLASRLVVYNAVGGRRDRLEYMGRVAQQVRALST
jgi:alkanesulfonate monooxygenase SsuD/methylene tetrahydromethanopterin reductase-like flavin-dependent oxidoreductase (luciferase family)